MTRKIADVTDGAVEEATGEDWDGWFAVLDERGGEELAHEELVAALGEAGVESGWWRQKIAVGYERSRGLREVGETTDAGYQIGVQRTLQVPREQVWEFLVGPDGRDIWLGETRALEFEPEEAYETDDGTAGEIRTVADGERVRLTWQPADWDASSTLQVTLSTPESGDDRTVLRFHQEGLADGEVREEMRDHWRDVCDRIEASVAADGA